MIDLIAMESTDTVGVRIDGKIQKEDIEKVERAFEAKFNEVEKVSIYVEIAKLGGIAFDALIEDLKFGFSNLKHFEKKAVVSQHEWLGKLADVGDKLFPSIHVKHFTVDEKEKAIAWINEA